MDKVRRQENRISQSEGDHRLKGTRQLWLFNQENLDEDSCHELLPAQRGNLKTDRAWAMKENFRDFRNRPSERSGKRFFDHWYSWAIRSRLEPIKKISSNAQEPSWWTLELLPASRNQCNHRRFQQQNSIYQICSPRMSKLRKPSLANPALLRQDRNDAARLPLKCWKNQIFRGPISLILQYFCRGFDGVVCLEFEMLVH